MQYVFIIFFPLPMPHRFSQPPLPPNFMFSLSLPEKENEKQQKQKKWKSKQMKKNKKENTKTSKKYTKKNWSQIWPSTILFSNKSVGSKERQECLFSGYFLYGVQDVLFS